MKYPLSTHYPKKMLAFITSAYGSSKPLSRFLEFAGIDRVKRHHPVNSPEEADIILFIEIVWEDFAYKQLLMHSIVKKFREKCFMYNEWDEPWCVFPGLYCAMPSLYFDRTRQRAVPYFQPVNKNIKNAGYAENSIRNAKYLFSFMGSRRRNYRKGVFSFKGRREAYIEDTTALNMFGIYKEDHDLYQRRYIEVIQNSKFILCPRGLGTSSHRIYEAMELGRIPVIISDQWVAPEGPDWEKFSVRVRQKNIAEVPELLEGVQSAAEEMGFNARQAWEEWFSPEKMFDYCIEQCAAILKSNRASNPLRDVRQLIPSLEIRMRRLLYPLKRIIVFRG